MSHMKITPEEVVNRLSAEVFKKIKEKKINVFRLAENIADGYNNPKADLGYALTLDPMPISYLRPAGPIVTIDPDGEIIDIDILR